MDTLVKVKCDLLVLFSPCSLGLKARETREGVVPLQVLAPEGFNTGGFGPYKPRSRGL